MDKQYAPQPSNKEAETPMSRGWSLSTFRQGVEAGKARLPTTSNPYPDGSDRAVIWLGGWQVGSSM